MANITKILNPIAFSIKRAVMMTPMIKGVKHILEPFSREQDHNMTPFSREKYILEPFGRGEEIENYSRGNIRPVIGRMVTRYRLLVGCLLGYRLLVGFISSDFFNLISEFSFNQLLLPL